jgi:hypothetical protein
MNFVEHLLCIWATTITTQNRVESAFVDNSVESLVCYLRVHLSDVHLFVSKRGVLLTIEVLHLLNASKGNVDVRDVLIALVKHFFG